MATLSDNTVRWAEARGISRSTLERAGVGSGTTGMPGLGQAEVIAFHYWRAGKAVNVKYRALSEKAFKQREGGEARFFNLDPVLGGAFETVYVTEGEFDVAALVEAGISTEEVLSVPTARRPRRRTHPRKPTAIATSRPRSPRGWGVAGNSYSSPTTTRPAVRCARTSRV